MATVPYQLRFPSYRKSSYMRSDDGFHDDSTALGWITWSNAGRRVTSTNPNWKVLLAKGVDATNPYEMSICEGRPLIVRGSALSPRGTVVVNTDIMAISSGTSVPGHDMGQYVYVGDDAALRDLALARLKRKLAASTKSAQALVPLVELRELHGLIRGTSNLSTSLLDTLLTIKRTKGVSAYKYASDAWLTWSFGIKPMISDTKSIVESIGEYLTRNDFNVRLTGTASKDWKSSARQIRTTGIFGADLNWSAEFHHTLSYRYIAGFDVNWKSANNYGLTDQLNLNFESLPSVAWELIPYSWLVDYFTTVGAYLDDTFSSNASTTKFVVLDRRYTMKAQWLGGYTAWPGRSANSTCRPGMVDYFSIKRSSLGTNLPTRQLRFKSLDEIGVNGVNRLLNLAALLVR